MVEEFCLNKVDACDSVGEDYEGRREVMLMRWERSMQKVLWRQALRRIYAARVKLSIFACDEALVYI
jgi:hypothetical protein